MIIHNKLQKSLNNETMKKKEKKFGSKNKPFQDRKCLKNLQYLEA